MMLVRLAVRNIIGAGMRTWLNAVVLSLVLVAIIAAQALLKGMNEQTARAVIASECGAGQIWHPEYDPYDPLNLDRAHGRIPDRLSRLVNEEAAAPVLIVQGAVYPEGRIQPVIIKGIDPAQQVVDLPSRVLEEDIPEIPALIGTRMAKSAGLRQGDVFTLQWRDTHGTFDAQDARVVQVFRTPVQSIDRGQIWVPLKRMRQMTDIQDEATLLVVAQGSEAIFARDGAPAGPTGEANGPDGGGEKWIYRDQDFLLQDIRILIQSKMYGSMFIYAILLFLALLAVFDTQVFSIFKRQKEIGTMVALGMTRDDVVKLFTLEGLMSGLLAALLAAVYGIPLLWWFKRTGWHLPETTDSYGFAIGDVLYPIFSIDVVLGTGIVVLLLTALVSFLPTRRISRVDPTQALRGKVF
jgi:putative ABC transport system permease protein